MTTLLVRLYDENGVPKDNGLFHRVDASEMIEAAQKLCTVPLTQNPRHRMYLRADVKHLSKLNEDNLYYEVDQES